MALTELSEKKSTGTRMKFRSVSVDDLESVVKKLIEEALETNEETIQLEMVVYEEESCSKFDKITTGNSESRHLFQNSHSRNESEKNDLENDTLFKSIKPTEEVKFIEECDKKLDHNLTKNSKTEDKTITESSNRTEELNKLKDLRPLVNKNISKLTKCPKVDLKETEASREVIQNKGDFSFEAWKAAKTKIYKQLLKEERRKRHQQLLESAKKIEKEREAHMVYDNWKRDQEQQQKLNRMRAKTVNETIAASKINKSEEKRYANMQAFNEWKKRKDAKIRREKMMWRAHCQQYNLQYSSVPPMQAQPSESKVNIDLDNWLDQVNHVLHQKYVKERRFQVRSFYCQPVYYGINALIH